MREKISNVKRSALLCLTAVMLLGGVFLKSLPVQAATETVKLTEISAPGEIDGLVGQDVGIIATHTPDKTGWGVSTSRTYYNFTVTERGWVVFDLYGKVLHDDRVNGAYVYSNASLTKKIKEKTVKTGENAKRTSFYLEPGTYYLECYYSNITQTVYGYFLPASKVLKASAALAADKTAAAITVSSPVSSYKIDWAPDKIAVDDVNKTDKFPNTTLADTFEVEDNGTYTLRLSSTLEEWKDFPVSVSIDVAGIVKCDHSFTAYDSNASGHIVKCSKCGRFETGKKLSHTMDKGTVTKKATTMQKGSKVYKCAYCKYVLKTEELPKLKSHAYHKVLTDTKTKAKYRVIVTADKGKPAVEYVKPTGNVSSVTIPATVKIEGVTYLVSGVASNAFKNNTKLTKVEIGKNVKSIGANAFFGCKKLKTVTIQSTKITSVGKNAIKDINKKAVIKVPKSKKKAYTKLFTAETGFKDTMQIK